MDRGILELDPVSKEFTLVSLPEGDTVAQVPAATGWSLKIGDLLQATAIPTSTALAVRRDLNERIAPAYEQ